ncbi:MAG: hypothetical protein ABI183_21560 [Polyangiaceae bacterium]
MASETERARLINDISVLLREPKLPESTRTAGLTLIGWLARRMPGECAHAIGVCEALQAAQSKSPSSNNGSSSAVTGASSMKTSQLKTSRRKSER